MGDEDQVRRFAAWAIRLYERLHVHMHIGRVYYPSATIDLNQTNKEHEAIVEALEHRDGTRLREAVGSHIRRVRGFIAATAAPPG